MGRAREFMQVDEPASPSDPEGEREWGPEQPREDVGHSKMWAGFPGGGSWL